MPLEGQLAPPIVGHDFINDLAFDGSNLGKIVIVSFVDRSYPEVDILLPCLAELWNNFGGGVEIFAVVHEGNENDAETWLRSMDIHFHGIFSPDLWNQYMVGIDLSEQIVPHSFIISRDMIIRNRYVGYSSSISHPDCNDIQNLLSDYIHERAPIDLEMVMDVSGSMTSPSPEEPNGDAKIDMLKQAISIIGDFLEQNGQINDRMGLIWFTDDVDEHKDLIDQHLLPIPTNWADLRRKVNALDTGNCTAMGPGLQKAFNNLLPSTQKRFAILCTDGMQNINPLVTKVTDHYEIIGSNDMCGPPSQIIGEHPGIDIASYNTNVHTIGVGITANYINLLEEVANMTGASYKGTHDPATDLDFLYFVQLCNVMAGGSPSIVHHNAGNLLEKEHEKVETFNLNRSIRKISVILAWKKFQRSNFMFWLYSPNGILLNLHREMRFYENHCMATIYLPKRQNGDYLKYIGKWRMIIKGELPADSADYHVIIIGEDTEIKLLVDYPRKSFEVGDLLTLKLGIFKNKEPILIDPEDITIEIKSLPEPLSKLLAEYKVSIDELVKQSKLTMKKAPKNPLVLKVNAMTSDPQFQKRLIPSTRQISLKKGDLDYKIEEGEVFIPIPLKEPGLHSFKIIVRYESQELGPICRTDMVSIIVGPGKADPEQSIISIEDIKREGLKGKIITINARNEKGQLLGPGHSNKFKLEIGKEEYEVEVNDT
ncbi:MAG: VWA domain-containing protein, partial [Promethearchaeota archaeon]